MRFLGILLVLVLSSCDSKDCSDFKEGRFKLIGEQAGDVIVERRGDRQYEMSESGEFTHEFKLTWLSDCKYQLVFEKTDKPSAIGLSSQDTLTVEILSTDGDRCNTRAQFKDLSFEVVQQKIN